MANLIILPMLALAELCPLPASAYPATMSVYDPALGGVNCDDNCKTVAEGMLEDWMYKTAGACPNGMLNATVHFPSIDHSMECVDTGPAIRPQWSVRDQQCVTYFDTLWPLERDGKKITGQPYWTMWYIPQKEWYITWN